MFAIMRVFPSSIDEDGGGPGVRLRNSPPHADLCGSISTRSTKRPGCGQRNRAKIHISVRSGCAMDGRTHAFFAYANNYLLDLKVAIILDVEASSAHA